MLTVQCEAAPLGRALSSAGQVPEVKLLQLKLQTRGNCGESLPKEHQYLRLQWLTAGLQNGNLRVVGFLMTACRLVADLGYCSCPKMNFLQ